MEYRFVRFSNCRTSYWILTRIQWTVCSCRYSNWGELTLFYYALFCFNILIIIIYILINLSSSSCSSNSSLPRFWWWTLLLLCWWTVSCSSCWAKELSGCLLKLGANSNHCLYQPNCKGRDYVGRGREWKAVVKNTGQLRQSWRTILHTVYRFLCPALPSSLTICVSVFSSSLCLNCFHSFPHDSFFFHISLFPYLLLTTVTKRHEDSSIEWSVRLCQPEWNIQAQKGAFSKRIGKVFWIFLIPLLDFVKSGNIFNRLIKT